MRGVDQAREQRCFSAQSLRIREQIHGMAANKLRKRLIQAGGCHSSDASCEIILRPAVSNPAPTWRLKASRFLVADSTAHLLHARLQLSMSSRPLAKLSTHETWALRKSIAPTMSLSMPQQRGCACWWEQEAIPNLGEKQHYTHWVAE